MRSRIEPMKKIVRSLGERRELILNYFRAQNLVSSGVVEGMNNKAKVTVRKISTDSKPSAPSNSALYHPSWQATRVAAGDYPPPLHTREGHVARCNHTPQEYQGRSPALGQLVMVCGL